MSSPDDFRSRLFDAWAPRESVWSAWVKPVLIATADARDVSGETFPLPEGDWMPSANSGTALVLDLPGPGAVRHGLALAKRGYRPVPLFNAVNGPGAILEQRSIITELVRGAEILRGLSLAPDAPPAFLLDARRTALQQPTKPGILDNRWVCFPQDFPSHRALAERGIRTVVLMQERYGPPQQDLAHVLLRWEEGGLDMRIDMKDAGSPVALNVPRPKHFRSIWQRILAYAGFRRNSAGGFGSVIPEVAQGGGYS